MVPKNSQDLVRSWYLLAAQVAQDRSALGQSLRDYAASNGFAVREEPVGVADSVVPAWYREAKALNVDDNAAHFAQYCGPRGVTIEAGA